MREFSTRLMDRISSFGGPTTMNGFVIPYDT